MSGDRVIAHGRSSPGGGPATLVVVHDSGGAWIFHGPEGRVGVRLLKAETVRLCRAVLDRSMTARPYDPWRDVDGTPISVGCRVEQVTVHKEYGALSCRLHWLGRVVDRGHSRVGVHFDNRNDDRVVSVRPHLLRVITPRGGGTDE